MLSDKAGGLLRRAGPPPVLVTHINHPHERTHFFLACSGLVASRKQILQLPTRFLSPFIHRCSTHLQLRPCDGNQMTTAARPRPRRLLQPGFLRSLGHGLCSRCLFLLCFLVAAFASSSSAGRVVTSLPGFDGDLPFHLETGCVPAWLPSVDY